MRTIAVIFGTCPVMIISEASESLLMKILVHEIEFIPARNEPIRIPVELFSPDFVDHIIFRAPVFESYGVVLTGSYTVFGAIVIVRRISPVRCFIVVILSCFQIAPSAFRGDEAVLVAVCIVGITVVEDIASGRPDITDLVVTPDCFQRYVAVYPNF